MKTATKTATERYDEALEKLREQVPGRMRLVRLECIAAIDAAVAEERARWHEWLRLRYSDEWIATCGDLPS